MAALRGRERERAQGRYRRALKKWAALQARVEEIARRHGLGERSGPVETTPDELRGWIALLRARDEAYDEYRAAERWLLAFDEEAEE